ncbi:acyltransferase family protein [Phenylobacterium sp.]|jgi:hypothetical membrane protein/surface polysaccharide O-acyltransferase-like enzyme|uniref:acyltransferase family protein n=1 Tax=Phenylobacterium sp. TaxID=1871053 RepID=UPI002E30333E|nr:acyltransferase family protein [Phenylobacterium sp.]HEX2559944.1 acyltransferase family protein [Phenylobacterium sp.]
MNRTPQTPAPSGDFAGWSGARRADLDWLRIGAFGLLILFHVGLVYAPYDWHIQSTHRFGWMEGALLLSSPWRLTLLFLVSGAALRFMTRRRTAGEVASARMERLLPPLIFGTLVLIPPQSFIEATDKGFWSGDLAHWWLQEFSPAGLSDGVPVNHLWFLVYLTAYTLAVVPLMARPQLSARLGDALETSLRGWGVLLVPIVYLVVVRLLIYPWIGVTNRLTWDWYNHAQSFGAFLFGYLLVGRQSVWDSLERLRGTSLALAAGALGVMVAQAMHPGGGAFWGVPQNIAYGFAQWLVIAAVLGFASRHLRNANTPLLTYLTNAVFPMYLAHQTILVVAVWLLKPALLPAGLEALILVAVTLGGSLLVYEVVRRIPFIRPIWGLKPSDAAPSMRFARRRALLRFGIAAPLLAAAFTVMAVLAYPDFNHSRQYLSELGGPTAANPLIFNTGVLAAAVLAGLAGLGLGLSVLALTGARILGGLIAVVFVLAGFGLGAAALYPWPDPRHLAINLALGIQLAPLLLLWALWGRRDLKRLKQFLAAVFVVMAALTVVTKHLVFPGLVNDANVGWWERAYAVVLVGWVGVAAFLLERRLRAEAPNAPIAQASATIG